MGHLFIVDVLFAGAAGEKEGRAGIAQAAESAIATAAKPGIVPEDALELEYGEQHQIGAETFTGRGADRGVDQQVETVVDDQRWRQSWSLAVIDGGRPEPVGDRDPQGDHRQPGAIKAGDADHFGGLLHSVLKFRPGELGQLLDAEPAGGIVGQGLANDAATGDLQADVPHPIQGFLHRLRPGAGGQAQMLLLIIAQQGKQGEHADQGEQHEGDQGIGQGGQEDFSPQLFQG